VSDVITTTTPAKAKSQQRTARNWTPAFAGEEK
jgi:hypothetical protein